MFAGIVDAFRNVGLGMVAFAAITGALVALWKAPIVGGVIRYLWRQLVAAPAGAKATEWAERVVDGRLTARNGGSSLMDVVTDSRNESRATAHRIEAKLDGHIRDTADWRTRVEERLLSGSRRMDALEADLGTECSELH